jgi:ParB/RepB/Spo0J family partition protein
MSQNLTIATNNVLLDKRWNRQELGDLRTLIQSIKKRGILVPLIVRKNPSDATGNTVILVDGRRRLACAQNTGMSEVPIVYTKSQDSKDAFMDSMVVNLTQLPNTPYEIASSYEEQVTRDRLTMEEIAASCGKTVGHVAQYRTALRVAKLHPDLLKAFKTGSLGPSVFRALNRINHEKHPKLFASSAQKALSKQYTVEALDVFVTQQLIRAGEDVYVEKATKVKVKKEPNKRGRPRAQAVDPTIHNYKRRDLRDQMHPIRNKDTYHELLVYHSDLARTSKKKIDISYHQGVVLGLELAAGLKEYVETTSEE